MSKMKHLLRKLHIGGGINEHHRLGSEIRPVADPIPGQVASQSNGRIETVEPVGRDRTAANARSDAAVDFNFLEEEFQVQLALAISASDTGAREDPESAQIDAAKRISLGCSVTGVGSETDASLESLSLRYWSYNIVNYNEQVKDGFYDVYDITSSSLVKGKMPLLVDLQAISVSDNANYEVILINRLLDPELQGLEKRAYIVSSESQVSGSTFASGLIQKIADIVVSRMGGPVDDADDISRRWTKRRCELQNAQNSIILPLGSLGIGLSRHRALLFKVLADRVNLPCMLVKGSYYTGTDDGAVNLIKLDNGSEYIIDLMGAPGTLIPAEVPSSHLPNPGYDLRGFSEGPQSSALLLTERHQADVSSSLDFVPQVGSLVPEEALLVGVTANEVDMNMVGTNQTARDELEEAFLSPQESYESSLGTKYSKAAQNMKVNNVLKYVISAAMNPEFAQKLQAILLEIGALPPPDLFPDIILQDPGEEEVLQRVHLANGLNLDGGFRCNFDDHLPGSEEYPLNNVMGNYDQQSAKGSTEKQGCLALNVLKCDAPLQYDTSEGFVDADNRMNQKLRIGSTCLDLVPVSPFGIFGGFMHENQIGQSFLSSATYSCQIQSESALLINIDPCSQAKKGKIFNTATQESAVDFTDAANSSNSCNGFSDKLGEVAEWEVPWEDLQIGERIGIGSCGEVYHADWNGTEVAVKKFLDQDISGDALIQFKYEAEIMLRLRHPNVVLFMGAVTRPPHLSILTEFLPRGSLYKLLHRSSPKLDEKRRVQMALDIAKGMNYLHTSHPPIVHRDLKSPNLLVDKNWVVKVCDFGLSRMKHHTFLSSKSTAGTPEWMAPEVLRNEPANEKCDVYSFGVILWELATCDIPWKGMNPMQVVGAVGFQNRHLEIPDTVDPVVAHIICDCWQKEPHLRPSFSELISRLRHIQHV